MEKSHSSKGKRKLCDLDQQQQQQETQAHKKSKVSSIWVNLDLILSLQSNDLSDQRKIELAFEFVNSNANLRSGGPQAVSISRLAAFLSDWIQPLLIPKEKSSGLWGPSLDYRYWAALKFCLKNSPVVVSLNLLKSVTQVLKYNDESSDGKTLLESVLDCIKLILPSNARTFYNASMDLWKPCLIEIVGAVRKSSTNDAVSRISYLLMEHFVNFLRFHKDPTNNFSKFVDGLLDPLLELLVLLHLRNKEGKFEQVGSLLRLVEDVLSNGLFHPANIGGFFSLGSSSTEQKAWAPKGHREFFKKLGNIITEKNAMALWGFGYLFRLFVTSAKTKKAASLTSKSDGAMAKSSETSNENKETSKPLFEVFVQFMQPLLLECKRCSKKESGKISEDRLLEIHGMLKSVNETLVSFIEEKVYMRTEDTSEGAHYNFLKEVYDAIVSISGKLYRLWSSTLDMGDGRLQKMLPLVAGEVVGAIRCLLEIEYKVVEDDLVKLWLIMFSFLAVHISVEDIRSSLSLTSDILKLGCKLIDIYSELRQVDCPLFALCKAARLLGNAGDADMLDYSVFVSLPLSSHSYLKSMEFLLSSQDLRTSINNAINLIPEGQASRCVQQLEVDITGSLQWMKSPSLRDGGINLTETDKINASLTYLDVQAELLGRFFSEIYITLLDSLTVTTTNSISIGNSMKNLMGAVGISFGNLVKSQSGSIDEFIFSVIGRRLHDQKKPEIDGGIWLRPLSISWILVFFFRVYISCRSLYRQLISLMPPDSSAKAAKSMGSFFTVAREDDWEEGHETVDGGYFSWIVKPSISLLDLFKLHLEDFLSTTECPSLLYVIRIMALQRLSDLNWLIRAFEFLEGRDIKNSHAQRKKHNMILKQEANELTNFMIGRYITIEYDETDAAKPEFDDSWDLAICSLTVRSLHIAIWRLLCRNVDVWSAHASKKYIKKFLSCLFFYAVQDVKCSREISMQSTKETLCAKVTVYHISLEFLTNIVSFEQPNLRTHFLSGFCRVLEKSLAPIISHVCASNKDLGSLPDWPEFLNILEKGPLIVSDDKITSLAHSSLPKPNVVLPNSQYVEFSEQQSSSFTLELRTCESLLNLLSKIPKVHLDAKSFSVYATYALNLERFAISSLLHGHDNSFICNRYELLRLLISCRRVMKYLVLASLEDNSGAANCSSISSLFYSSDFILWLLRSVSEIVGLLHTSYGVVNSSWAQDVLFPLIDHTSYIFLAISERQMNAIKPSLESDEKFNAEYPVQIMADIFKEQMVSLGNLCADKLDNAKVVSCSKFAVNVSCFQGFLWGLVSAIDSMNDDTSTINPQLSRSIHACSPKLNECITLYEDIINHCFSIGDNCITPSEQSLSVDSSTLNPDNDGDSLSGFGNNKNLVLGKQKLQSLNAVAVYNVIKTIHKTDLLKLQNLKGSLLQNLLEGEDPLIAFTLRQLFTTSAAILQLRSMLPNPKSLGSKTRSRKLAASSIRVLLGTSLLILRETAEMVDKLDPFSFVWLDGVLTYLEAVGSSNADLNLPEDFYSQLIDTHLRAIGKCISLQGKSATLSSHESGTSTKMLQSFDETSRNGVQNANQVKFSINAFKARLRISFKKFIRPTKFDLMIALQSLEKALVGVRQDCNMVYEISTGNLDGGEVTPIVAAGIDCLESVLECFSGHELLVGKISSFVNAVLNVILHLQNPTIFYLEQQPDYKSEAKPDAGSVILMCVEILTSIAGNISFRMEPWHVSQCLHIPLALFNGFYQLKDSCISFETSTFLDNQKLEPLANIHHDIVDHKFSVELYASCCRLLCATLKHGKRHADRCIAIIEESVSTLLNCLEMVDTDLIRGKGYFSWELQEAIKCASFLRRIYEEIRNQKDAFAEHSLYFLSNYISMFSGCGPLKTGIKREIDEALRPGVYSLIDICSEADFQQLHTSLGEGPCRSSLKTLLHDYQVNFQYEGKI